MTSHVQKEPRRKPKYGLLSCVVYIYRILWKYERRLALVGIVTVPISLCLATLALYLPSEIISVLETSDRFSYIALVIAGLLLAKLLLDTVQSIINTKISYSEHYVLSRLRDIRRTRKYDRDWYLRYDPEVDKMDDRALEALQNSRSSGVHFPMEFSGMITQILKFLLFGSVISLLHPAIILLLALGTVINALMSRWQRNKARERLDVRNALNKKTSYCTFKMAKDFRYAKEIRIYHMADSIRNRLNGLFALSERENRKLEHAGILTSMISFLVVLLRDGVAYAFLIDKAARGEVDASSFVLFFSAITAMSGLMSGILGTFNRVLDGALQISDCREELEIPDRLNRGQGILIPSKPFSIEFKNVSYQYPLGEKKVLDNVSFRIEAGEKIALVGLNGAGKTTLTMLMCGLLLPDEGEILLDGHSLMEYNRDEMYSLFGVVPQAYNLLPLSIAQNITAAESDDDIDYEKLDRCLKLSGFGEKVETLERGIHTLLNRRMNPDGIELSGGEAQKLLLARLLYRDPLCIILDEPTAALDPIAEDHIYSKYNEVASTATSVFISHRLASTRFCDRIFLLDGAALTERGTHEELMRLHGKYRELFDVQAKYYRENVAGADGEVT